MGDPRIVQCVALLSFTGEEGSLRAGTRFTTTRTRAEWLSNPIKGQRPALAQILYETVSKQPEMETKETVVEEKPKRKRTRKSSSPNEQKRNVKPKRTRGGKSKGDK